MSGGVPGPGQSQAASQAALAELDRLLARSAELDAQDLYLTVGALPVARVGAKLVPLGEVPLEREDLKRLASAFLVGRRFDSFRERPELDLAHAVDGAGRFRVNVFMQRGSLAIVARRIKPGVPTLEQLAMPAALKKLATLRQGLVCVTGATGSGKSTTLAAMIDYRNETTPGHILTIEDPIEFLHEHKAAVVSQREVGRDTARFRDALRSALRQAPDLLLVGEVRDAETAEAALHFAETGHLVLATLHSTNAAQTIHRLVHLFPSDQWKEVHLLLSLNLGGIVSQRLVPAVEGEGRVAAVELLVPTARMRDLIRAGDIEGVHEAMLEMRGHEDSVQTFDDALYKLVRERRITMDKALAYADGPNDLRLRFLVDRGQPEDELARIKVARD